MRPASPGIPQVAEVDTPQSLDASGPERPQNDEGAAFAFAALCPHGFVRAADVWDRGRRDEMMNKLYALFGLSVRYLAPGIVAHQSALRDGELLKVPDWGDAPR